MELRQLRYFVAVARNESFKKAAIELHIAQPALSRQISLLEHELKTSLFTRHTRGSLPTEDGLVLIEEAERILHLTEQAKQRILFRQEHIGGTVRIGMAPTLAEWIAPEILEQARAEFPDVTLHFLEGLSPRLRRMLIAGGVDVAVLSLGADPAHLHMGKAFRECISLVGHKDDPFMQREGAVRLSELVDLPMIVAGIHKEGIRDIVDRALSDQGLKLNRVVAEVETMLMARPMVAKNLAYTISIESAAERGLREGYFAIRPIEDLQLDRIIARSAEHAPSRAVLKVSSLLTDLLTTRFPKA